MVRFIECTLIQHYEHEVSGEKLSTESKCIIDLDCVVHFNEYVDPTTKLINGTSVIHYSNGNVYSIKLDYDIFKKFFLDYYNSLDKNIFFSPN